MARALLPWLGHAMTGTRCPTPLLLLARDVPNLKIAAGHIAFLVTGGEVARVTVRRDPSTSMLTGHDDEEVLRRMGHFAVAMIDSTGEPDHTITPVAVVLAAPPHLVGRPEIARLLPLAAGTSTVLLARQAPTAGVEGFIVLTHHSALTARQRLSKGRPRVFGLSPGC